VSRSGRQQPPRSQQRFRFAFEPYQLVVGLPFGVTPFTAWVAAGPTELSIRFGPWSMTTGLDNVAGVETTGPFRLLKVAGPPRLSLVDRGISFATRRSQGVCIRFHEPVPGILPFGSRLVSHPGATVTVADPEALVRALTGQGQAPGGLARVGMRRRHSAPAGRRQ